MPVKVRDLIKRLEKDGWTLDRVKGSHRQFVHDRKDGVVTVPGNPGDELPIGTEKNILKQAGLR